MRQNSDNNYIGDGKSISEGAFIELKSLHLYSHFGEKNNFLDLTFPFKTEILALESLGITFFIQRLTKGRYAFAASANSKANGYS
jgi:hypothetical protein